MSASNSAGDVLVPELSAFEQIKHRDDEGYEFWYARELMKLLGYNKWWNFERVIDEAMAVVAQEGPEAVASNFSAIGKNKAEGEDTRGRKGTDYILTRHACYVIAESADGRKDEVAWAKIYFAYTTERYELLAQTEEEKIRIEERQRILLHNSEMMMRLKQAGAVTSRQFATFFNRGYQGLYNGETAEDIRIRKGLSPKSDILDWMGAGEASANSMRAFVTSHHLNQRENLTLAEANRTHFDVGQRVRNFLVSEGIYIEKLPTPKKPYQQLLREQAFRERLAAEDRSGLWRLLEESDDEKKD